MNQKGKGNLFGSVDTKFDHLFVNQPDLGFKITGTTSFWVTQVSKKAGLHPAAGIYKNNFVSVNDKPKVLLKVFPVVFYFAFDVFILVGAR